MSNIDELLEKLIIKHNKINVKFVVQIQIRKGNDNNPAFHTKEEPNLFLRLAKIMSIDRILPTPYHIYFYDKKDRKEASLPEVVERYVMIEDINYAYEIKYKYIAYLKPWNMIDKSIDEIKELIQFYRNRHGFIMDNNSRELLAKLEKSD